MAYGQAQRSTSKGNSISSQRHVVSKLIFFLFILSDDHFRLLSIIDSGLLVPLKLDLGRLAFLAEFVFGLIDIRIELRL